MEQNGAHNQNSNSTQQMEENVKREQMEWRTGKEILLTKCRIRTWSKKSMGTEQVSRIMEEQGTTENLTSAGEVTSKEPFSIRKKSRRRIM